MKSLNEVLKTAEKILVAVTELTKLIADFVSALEDATKGETPKVEAPKKETSKEEAPKVEAPKKEVTLEEVRKVLTALSRDGHTAEVKALLVKHGVNRLSDVKAEDYETLLKEAEDITNA